MIVKYVVSAYFKALSQRFLGEGFTNYGIFVIITNFMELSHS
jgi:hypothetical protein